jgi:membrane protease YdiL (CAAX protease family)
MNALMHIPTLRRNGPAPVLWFLVIVCAVTWGIEFALIRSGIRFDTGQPLYTPTLWLLVTMWVPGLTALAVTAVFEGGGIRGVASALSLRPGPAGPYFLTLLAVPVIFAVIYALAWAAGFTTPDPTLTALTRASGDPEAVTLTTLFTVMLPASMVMGPAIQFIFALGEELGWRGFLLTRLLVLGKVRAYLLLGLIWGLWHAPLIMVGLNYPGHPIAGLFMMCAAAAACGLFINEMFLHSGSVLLAACVHAAVNAQAQGIWMWLFPTIDPLLGGAFGLTGVVVWLTAGALCASAIKRNRALRDPA